MNSDERRHLRQQFLAGVSRILPDIFSRWVEATNHATEKITMRLTLEVSAEISDEALMNYCDDFNKVGRIVGSRLRKRMDEELQKVLRDYYGR